MIRGIFQHAVIINNPNGGRVFKQAIFLVQPDREFSDRELADEAQKIIEQSTDAKRRGKAYR